MRTLSTGIVVGMVAMIAAAAGCSRPTTTDSGAAIGAEETTMTTAQKRGVPSVLDLTMNRIDGTPQPLSAYRGRVVLVVNVASKCGLTKQYAALESLYDRKKDEGLVVLGFPANDFMGQEPGTDAEIASFCSTEYGVTFPMFSKIAVTGDDAHPLFRVLTAESEAPTWNFTKYLLDREGNLVRRFDPRTAPDAPELTAEIDRLLSSG